LPLLIGLKNQPYYQGQNQKQKGQDMKKDLINIHGVRFNMVCVFCARQIKASEENHVFLHSFNRRGGLQGFTVAHRECANNNKLDVALKVEPQGFVKTRELGEIWKEGSKWKIKLPHGIETTSTKHKALEWKAAFKNTIAASREGGNKC